MYASLISASCAQRAEELLHRCESVKGCVFPSTDSKGKLISSTSQWNGMAADFLWGFLNHDFWGWPHDCTVPPSCQDEGCADGAECLWAASCVGQAFLSQRDAATQIWRVRSYPSKDRHIIAWYQHLASLARGTGAMRIQYPSRCDGNSFVMVVMAMMMMMMMMMMMKMKMKMKMRMKM